VSQIANLWNRGSQEEENGLRYRLLRGLTGQELVECCWMM
jgi:hypothetical protein